MYRVVSLHIRVRGFVTGFQPVSHPYVVGSGHVPCSRRPETNHFPPRPLFLGVPRMSGHLEIGAVDIRVEREDGGNVVESGERGGREGNAEMRGSRRK